MDNKWIRKGDKVLVIAGNEKGNTGKVLSRSQDKIIVEGLNIRKKHMKRQSKVSGGIVERETPMNISNVMLCNDKEEPIKPKVQLKDGKKILVYKSKGKEVTYREL